MAFSLRSVSHCEGAQRPKQSGREEPLDRHAAYGRSR